MGWISSVYALLGQEQVSEAANWMTVYCVKCSFFTQRFLTGLCFTLKFWSHKWMQTYNIVIIFAKFPTQVWSSLLT